VKLAELQGKRKDKVTVFPFGFGQVFIEVKREK